MELKGKFISPIVTTSITNQGMGFHSKRILTPGYSKVMEVIKETRTTNLAKSSTRFGHIGNVVPWKPWTAFQYVKKYKHDSMVNAVALTNAGAYYNAFMCLIASLLGYKVMPSIYVQFGKYGDTEAIQQGVEAYGIFKKIMGKYFIGADWNGSCGNTTDDIRKNLPRIMRLGKVAKEEFPDDIHSLKYSFFHPTEMLAEAAIYYDILHGINSISMGLLDPALEKLSPLYGLKNVNYGGSMSGGEISRFAWQKNYEVARAVEGTNCRLILAGGISNLNQARRYFNEIISPELHSIGICTAIERNSDESCRILEHYNG
ncbi:MAG: hypothetical protein US81_C0036G0002 [Parcubacteria group bacterium GW2011_GWE2_38_18]|nr:MAG: hypothetical protein US81_C0036G0002 [Parcubacteria group bacterium GW2011_GWE2_38_18]